MITTTEELKEVCQRFATHSFVTIDTEFLREYTFYSKLCLIQAASVEEAVLIDPLAKGFDLTPFFELLQNQNVVKVFHSGRQDIEIFYNMTKKVPFPVFDTQIAAMVLGYGDCVGYQQLVSDLLHIEIDKGMRVTDWSKRPLSEAQLQYALSDVTYLRDVYLMVKEKVEKQQRLSWIEEEMNELYDANLYEPSNEKIASKLKYNFKSNQPKYIYQDLYLWREDRAKKHNMPRRQVLKDEVMQDIARAHPKSLEELSALRSIIPSFLKKNRAREIVDVVKNALLKKPEDFYPLPQEKKNVVGNKNLMSILHLLLDMVAGKEKIASKLIGTQEDLYQFVYNIATPAFMIGWRYEVFGKYAEQIKDGKVGLFYNPSEKTIEFKEI